MYFVKHELKWDKQEKAPQDKLIEHLLMQEPKSIFSKEVGQEHRISNSYTRPRTLYLLLQYFSQPPVHLTLRMYMGLRLSDPKIYIQNIKKIK